MNQKQLLKANAQTISNEELLESRGAYFINLMSNNEPLKLKNGKTLEVKIPKYSDSTMCLFYGERNDFGQMNWNIADTLKPAKPKTTYEVVISFIENDATTKMVITTDSIFDDNSFARLKAQRNMTGFSKYKVFPKIGIEKFYETIQLKKLGWINCDRFANFKNKTDLTLFYEEKDKESVSVVFIVFKTYNSVREEFWNLKYNKTSLTNLPVGAQVKLILIEAKGGEKYSYVKDITVNSGEMIMVDFKTATDETINKLFNDI